MPRYTESTALIAVDVQNDFADPQGSLYVPGGEEVVEVINQQLAAARGAGAYVVFTQDWHPSSTPHFAKDGGIWPVHCVGGSWGAELHPSLQYRPGDPVIRKGVAGEDGYSGFTVSDPVTGQTSPTDLEQLLRAANTLRVVVAGLATDYCVKATVIDAAAKGFETYFLPKAMRAVNLNPGDEQAAVEEMLASGAQSAN